MPIRSTMKGFGEAAQAAFDLLLPPRCPGSGVVVDRPGMVAPDFWRQLTFIEAPFCDTCGLPFNFAAPAGSLCAGCIDMEPDFDRARAAVTYNDASRSLVLALKYGDKLHAVKTFTPWLMRAGAELIACSDVIVPVPLHPRRLWQRRFNQSALIAEALAKETKKTYLPDSLQRKKYTVPQKGLSRAERDRNVKSAFTVPRKEDIKNKKILLIDDVMTSGATLNACARALKRGGAAGVSVLTIARVTRDEEY